MKRDLSLIAAMGWVLGMLSIGLAWAGQGDLIELVGSGEINWSQGVILAKGSGAPPKEARNIAQARLMAERAAIVDAKRNLMEVLKGVWVDSNTLVEKFIIQNDEIRLKAEGIIQGAVEIRNMRRYLSDGGIEVTMALNLRGEFLSLLLNPPPGKTTSQTLAIEKPQPTVPLESKKPEPVSASPIQGLLKEKPQMESKPEPSSPSSFPSGGEVPKPPSETKKPDPGMQIPAYTGLVVDARGLNMRPALIPRIFDESGLELYQGSYVPPEKAAQNGLVLYTRDLTAAQTHPRVGKNPLTVKALKVKAPALSDILLSTEGAQKLRPFAGPGTFLEECRVMIVLD